MLMIMATGTPISGKTTNAKALEKYFKSIGTSVEYVAGSHNNDVLTRSVYYWLNEHSSDVIILDGALMSVKDRSKVFDVVNSYLEKHPDMTELVRIVAVNSEFSAKFANMHNGKDGHKKMPDHILRNRIFSYQQAVKDEGFDMVYHTYTGQWLNVDRFAAQLDKKLGYDFPYNEEETKNSVKSESTDTAAPGSEDTGDGEEEE